MNGVMKISWIIDLIKSVVHPSLWSLFPLASMINIISMLVKNKIVITIKPRRALIFSASLWSLSLPLTWFLLIIRYNQRKIHYCLGGFLTSHVTNKHNGITVKNGNTNRYMSKSKNSSAKVYRWLFQKVKSEKSYWMRVRFGKDRGQCEEQNISGEKEDSSISFWEILLYCTKNAEKRMDSLSKN